MPISAEVICDSISPEMIRLTTFKLRYPKFIHGEFMTHRLFSRNASSSRAIPTAKLIEEVRSDALRAGPIFWGKNQQGMQAAEELSEEYESDGRISPRERAQRCWENAALAAAAHAEDMLHTGAHKQIVNRLLEPFSHINVLVSATSYDNFFGLRLDKAAQPEIQELARQMFRAMEKSIPKELFESEWHLPFISEEALDHISRLVDQPSCIIDVAIKVSVARCARVSYQSFDTGKSSTIEEDLKLYDRLLGSQPIHASPAEHQATPDTWNGDGDLDPSRVLGPYPWMQPNQHGNFRGWRQYRKMLKGEDCAPLPDEYLAF